MVDDLALSQQNQPQIHHLVHRVVQAGVIQISRPPGTVVPGGLMFSCGFLWHFAALYLRDGWGDRPETFTCDWKYGHLDFGGLKFGASPPKKNVGGKWFRGTISKPPRPIATKLCQTT